MYANRSSYCKTYWVFQNYRLHYSELQLDIARYFFGNVYLSRASCLQLRGRVTILFSVGLNWRKRSRKSPYICNQEYQQKKSKHISECRLDIEEKAFPIDAAPVFWGDCPTGRLRKEEKTCLLRASILEIELLGLLEKSPVIWETELDKKLYSSPIHLLHAVIFSHHRPSSSWPNWISSLDLHFFHQIEPNKNSITATWKTHLLGSYNQQSAN